MQSLGMRPRFQLVLEHISPHHAYQRIEAYIMAGSSDCTGMFRQPYMELMFKPVLRHYWSPRLSLEFAGNEQQTVIRGLIGPHPNVWTMFLALYGICALVSFVGVMLSYSQWSLGQFPWGIYWVIGAGAGALLLYVGSLLGQRMALEQTIRLRRYLEESLGEMTQHLRVES